MHSDAVRRADERVDPAAADWRLALVVFGRQQVPQHLLERELAEIAAQLRRLQHALKLVEAAALLENAAVGGVQIAERLGDLERLLLDGGACLLSYCARFVAHRADGAGQRLRGLLQGLGERAVHFGRDDVEPLSSERTATDACSVWRPAFSARTASAPPTRPTSRAAKAIERTDRDMMEILGHTGSSDPAYGMSTIFPYAPGFSTSSCARGASASGISLPTCGLYPAAPSRRQSPHGR